MVFKQQIICIFATVVSAIFLLSGEHDGRRDCIQFQRISTCFSVRESYRGDNDPALQMIGVCPGGFGSASTRHASYPVRSHLVRRRTFPRVDRKSRIGAAQIKLYRPRVYRVYKRAGLSDCFSSLELQARLSLCLSFSLMRAHEVEVEGQVW